MNTTDEYLRVEDLYEVEQLKREDECYYISVDEFCESNELMICLDVVYYKKNPDYLKAIYTHEELYKGSVRNRSGAYLKCIGYDPLDKRYCYKNFSYTFQELQSMVIVQVPPQ